MACSPGVVVLPNGGRIQLQTVIAAVKLLVRIYMQFPHACADSWQAVADLGEGWVGGP